MSPPRAIIRLRAADAPVVARRYAANRPGSRLQDST